MSVLRGANPFDMLTPVTKRLIIANVVVYFAQMLVPAISFTDLFGLRPVDIVAPHYHVWTLVTYGFVHGNIWHIFFNMFALWMFGPHVEAIWGARRFTIYYFACLLGAALVQCLIPAAQDTVVVGASGAIYGLLLAFGFLMPDAVIYLFFFFPVRAIQAVLFIAALTLMSAVHEGGSPIAYFAHLGGMLTGYLYFKVPMWMERARFWQIGRRFRNPKGAPQQQERRRREIESLSEEVDRILEKISSQGVSSLTPEEHETMQRYSRRRS